MCFLWINVLKIQAQNHIHSGDIEVNTQSEVDELADNELTEGINKINGNVSIIQEVDENGNPVDPITDLSVFSAIDTIMGYIKVERTSSLGTLSKVETADNGMTIYTGFASLDTLGGDFSIGSLSETFGNSGLDSLGYFRDLKGIGGNFYVEENDNLIFLGTFPKLESIGSYYKIAYNENLISLGFFNVLQSIGGDFSVRFNDNLQNLGTFPKLESIDSDYEIGFNENLISLGFFNVLQSIGDDFSVRFNDNLQTLGNFPVLTNIDGDVNIHDNLMLRYCCAIKDFANFENDQFYGFVSISGNAMGCDNADEINCDSHLSTHLPEIYAEHTDTISNFSIISDGKWRLRKPAVGAEWITDLAIKGKTGNLSRIEGEKESFITIKHTKNNDSDQRKTTLILESIDSNGTVLNFPESTSLSVIQVSNKTYIGNISVGTQTEISDLSTSLTGVTKIMGNISVLQKMDENGTPIDPIIDLSVFSTIDTITGSLMMKGADSLRTLSKVETADNGMTTYIGFAALDTIGGDFSIGHSSAAFGNSGLDSLGYFRDLKGIGGNFHIEQNDNMVILGSFPKLKNIGGESIIIANDDLQTLGNFNSLQHIGENFSVRFNDNLQTLGNFNSLQNIETYFFVTNNDSLQTLGNFDSLQTIGRYFFVTNNGNLQTLGNFSSLQTIREHFSVTNNSNLQTLGIFNSLQTIGKHFFVTNNNNLQTLGNFNAITNVGIERVFISSLRRSEDNVSIVIENNTNLSDCCAIAELLSANNSGVAGKIFITGNAVGCDSRDNIISRRCRLIPVLTLISENSSIDHNDTSPIAIQFNVGGSAMGWTASIDSSFISLNKTNGNSGNNISLVATPTSENMGSSRTATLTITTTGENGISETLTITQRAVPPTHTLTLISEDSTIDHNDTSPITIQFNVGGSAMGWTASIDSSFISLNKTNGNSGNNISLIATPTSENMGSSRTAALTITTTGENGISETLTITQRAVPPTHSLTLISENSTVDYNDTSPITIQFNVGGSAMGWTASIDSSFISLNKTNGNSGNNISLIATPTSVNMGLSRTATLTITTTGENGISETLTITQRSVPHTLTLISENSTVDYNDTSPITIQFSVGGSAMDWTASIDSSFISLNKTNGNSGNNINLVATPTSANTGSSRTATITITTTGENGISETLTITQRSVPPTHTLTLISEDSTIDHNDTSPITIQFNVGGGAMGWTASIDSSFISLNKTNGNSGNNISLVATPTSENMGSSRTATLTITTTGENGISETLTITQRAVPPTHTLTLISEDSTIDYNDTSPITIQFNVGGSAMGWTASIDSSFISLNKTNGNSGNNISLVATPTSENTGSSRTATITISTTGQLGDPVTAQVMITQAGAPGSPTLEITPPSRVRDTVAYTATATSDSVEIVFTVGGGAMSWESMISYETGEDEFITLSDTANVDQTGEIRIKAAVMENQGVERSATITLSTTGQSDNFSAVTREITIVQRGAPPTLTLNLSDTTIAYDATDDIDIMFNVGGGATAWWATVMDGDKFLVLATDTIRGNEGTNTIRVTITENVDEERMDTIVITTDGGTGVVTDTVIVTQKAVPMIEITDPSDGMITIDYDVTDAQIIAFDVGGSAIGWTASVDSSFISLNKTSGNSGNNITLVATPTSTNTGSSRTVTLTITTTGENGNAVSETLTITQRAAPHTLTLISENSSIDHNDTSPITIQFSVGGSAMGWTSAITYTPADSNFITLSPTEGTDITTAITLMATPTENTGMERIAMIMLRTTGHEGTPDSVSLTITQGANTDTTVSPKDTTTLSSHTKESLFTFYPNPTERTLTIEEVTGYLQIYIYDLVGREVMTYSLPSSKKTIDVSELPSGMYLISLQNNKERITKVLIKK